MRRPCFSHISPSLGELLRGGCGPWRGARVVVVGDAVLDRYEAEAGGSVRWFAGGAGVIAAHVAAMGAEATLVTLAGSAEDQSTRRLVALLEESRVTYRLVERPRGNGAGTAGEAQVAVPVKARRVVSRGGRVVVQKISECDAAPAGQPGAAQAVRQAVREALMATQPMSHWDAVIFADFGYGTVSAGLLEDLSGPGGLRDAGFRGVLAGDVSGPRPSLGAMRGFDVLTPTESELRSLAGGARPGLPLEVLGAATVERMRLAHLVVTRDARGCVRFDESGATTAYPSVAGDVVDEVGAGDAMLAAVTLALAAGVPIDLATRLGSLAAAAAVTRVGNEPVTLDRIRGAYATTPQAPRAATRATSAA